MIRNFKTWLGVGILAASAALPIRAESAAAPNGAPADRSAKMEARIDRMANHLADALELSADQRNQFDTMRANMKAQIAPIAQDLRTGWQELKAMTEAATPDPTAIGQKVLDLKAKRDAMKTAHEQFQTSLRAILTTDQQSKLDSLKTMGKGMFGDHRHGFDGFGHRGGPWAQPPADGSN